MLDQTKIQSSASHSDRGGIRLLDAVRRPHDDAFGRLFETFRRHLLILAHRELPHALRRKIAPSDVVQETAVDAQRDYPGFRGSTPEECFSWLRSILRNNMVDAVRRYETSQKRAVGREISLESEAGRRESAMLDFPHTLPDSSAIRRENADVLASTLTRLPEDYRTVIHLRYWEGLSFPEIGVRLSRSPDAVRKLWYRAVERLKQELNDAPTGVIQNSNSSDNDPRESLRG